MRAPLTMRELRETVLEALLALKEYEPGYRAKSATLYLPMVETERRSASTTLTNSPSIRTRRQLTSIACTASGRADCC